MPDRPTLNLDYQRRPYWHATMPAIPSYRDRPLPDTADVVVIGGGYTGINAARELARKGAAVTLLEAETLGFGGSTRNGGIVHPGYKWGRSALIRKYGDDTGRALWDETMAGYDTIKRVIAEEAIECEFREHGYLDLAWSWQPVVDALPPDCHYLAPSFRGHGASDWIGDGAMYYFLDYVADLASLVQVRARPRLSIVGHSMGGMVAAYYTGAYPERVERLVLIEGLSVGEDPTSPARMRESNGMRADSIARRGTQDRPGSRRFASIAEAAARMRHHDPELPEPLSLELARHGTVMLPSGQYAFRHDPLLAPRTPIGFEVAIAERFWRNVSCPVLYVEGARSTLRLAPEELKRRVGAFRDVTSATLPGASHMMIRHDARALTGVLAPFLELTP